MSTPLQPATIRQYYVFLASPGDVSAERESVRRYFDRYNRQTAQLWNVRFQVIDWENYATVGVGRPQELVTSQTLERFKDSLALVIGLMSQRFGSPTGKAESGTREEFDWALSSHKASGFPEIKWFFKRIEQFSAPTSPEEILSALDQWKKVCEFRNHLKKSGIFFSEYPDSTSFSSVFENDLGVWLASPERPWVPARATTTHIEKPKLSAPLSYYQCLERAFYRLDIAGIDNDRSFEIPLSEIYVRLRVLFEEDASPAQSNLVDTGPIEIQTALLKFRKLVIVGDPGSGKSTFLKYIALALAQAATQANPSIALDKLCIQEPLPIPIFISCWDLSDYLSLRKEVSLNTLCDFLAERLNTAGFSLTSTDIAQLLATGSCCLLFDGLDEVPTDGGRSAVSRLLEDCVKKHSENRFVVTSRVRAYTGDAILKGEFTRCDILPFNESDRAQFLCNWISLLFKVSRQTVVQQDTEANREFVGLTREIESNDRIRPLAVNPLLLTVIAIVHWNRKRLPEQRVVLYDECVDVLLGQRKEAELIQLNRKTNLPDAGQEQKKHEERAWIRKRFAEIALFILSGSDNRDEVTKADIVNLLAPRFIDQGATNREQAEIRASLFLARQELKSGLLVSRRELSYRFVHLTFQEYLAAWHLSNRDFDEVAPLLERNIRQQRWFETFQLLGGEWAKQSDEKLDRYLSWLLSLQGESVFERAPVIALCANIVRDITGVAELRPETRKTFLESVEGTLDAFRADSGIPALTQLEILEALGQIGAAVKPHLISATKSGLFQVRRRAIEMLLPHLDDAELFAMSHILSDRSKEPIKTYYYCMLSRSQPRFVEFLMGYRKWTQKATEAFSDITWKLKSTLNGEDFEKLLQHVFRYGNSYYTWSEDYCSRSVTFRFMKKSPAFVQEVAASDREAGVRMTALMTLVTDAPKDPHTWRILTEQITNESTPHLVRTFAIPLLAKHRADDPATWITLKGLLGSGKSAYLVDMILNSLKSHAGEKAALGSFVKEASLSEIAVIRYSVIRWAFTDIRAGIMSIKERNHPAYYATPTNAGLKIGQLCRTYARTLNIEEVRSYYERLIKALRETYGIEIQLIDSD